MTGGKQDEQSTGAMKRVQWQLSLPLGLKVQEKET